jgi:hypothetical protein
VKRLILKALTLVVSPAAADPALAQEHQGSTSERPSVRSLPSLRGLLSSTGGGAALAVLGVGVVLTIGGLVVRRVFR